MACGQPAPKAFGVPLRGSRWLTDITRPACLNLRPQACACENSMKKCPYCGAEYPDDLAVCPVDQTPIQKDYQPIVKTESKRKAGTDENRRRTQELRWFGFQRLSVGVVLICFVGVLCFMFLDEDADLHSNSYSGGSYVRGRGMGVVLLVGVFGVWSIVRGVIYLVRAQSGDEHFAKGVDDAMDKYEKKQEARMGQKVGDGSMYNVLVLLLWCFLFLAVVGAIYVGYLFWTRP